MSYSLIPSADYKAACDAIRAKTGKTGTIKSGAMASEIASIQTGGGGIPKELIERTATQITQQGLAGVTQIGAYAFYNSNNLQDVYVADSVTQIGEFAFSNCENLNWVEIGEGIKTIGSKAFFFCESLEGVDIYGHPDNIAIDAFVGCENLVEIYVPWSEGEVDGAPWGAENATIYYDE